jgi:hypothetical protein
VRQTCCRGEFRINQAEAEVMEKSSQLAYDIRTKYAERQAERAKLDLLRTLRSVNQETLRLTEARVKEGDVAPLEASLLKVEISRSVVADRSAENRLATAEHVATIEAIALASLFARTLNLSLHCLHVLPRGLDDHKPNPPVFQVITEAFKHLAAKAGTEVKAPICAVAYGSEISNAVVDYARKHDAR